MRQEVLMEQLGVDQIYIDRSSGKNANRPELKTMLEFVRKGDVVIVESISRFARNTKDLLELVEQLTAKGVEFISQKVFNTQCASIATMLPDDSDSVCRDIFIGLSMD